MKNNLKPFQYDCFQLRVLVDKVVDELPDEVAADLAEELSDELFASDFEEDDATWWTST